MAVWKTGHEPYFFRSMRLEDWRQVFRKFSAAGFQDMNRAAHEAARVARMGLRAVNCKVTPLPSLVQVLISDCLPNPPG
ncbi:unnamed protein product [Prunus armeniaca]